MATKHGYGSDPGLTARMMTTMFLLFALYGVVVAVLLLVHVPWIPVLVIALVVLGVQYFASDKIALFSMKARIVTPEQAPQLHAVVDRLCALANMRKPKVAIADTDIPNAFATGRNQKHSVVCATTGILRRLDEPELEAVLSHELSHVAHRDVAVMTIASFLGIIAGFVTRAFYWADMFGIGDDRNGYGALFELAGLLFSAVFWFISFLLIRALSRYRELAADRSGAILIGQPRLLANALVKVTGEMARVP
ncbi:MAG TPA: zinc metalloprotease HtpX, partial [Acidimicrobiales bacterium]|nr:zinc metalloprotease HtpX [Acidimicrobiales bacterium]